MQLSSEIFLFEDTHVVYSTQSNTKLSDAEEIKQCHNKPQMPCFCVIVGLSVVSSNKNDEENLTNES